MATSEATAGQTADQYGQFHPVETEELISTKLKEFETEVAKFSEEDRASVILAEEKCPQLITEDFKLLFLRAEVFNADLAAKRYVRYWAKRREICGDDKAFLPITLDGALRDDEVALNIGFVQLIPDVKDPIGRAIVYMDPSKQDRTKYERKSMVRVLWYMLHAGLEQVEAQKHGVVFIGNPNNAKLSQLDRELIKMNVSSIQGAIPLRLSAIHVCRPPSFIRVVQPILMLIMSERTKKRFQVHFGSQEKVMEKLASFGLGKGQLPRDMGGEVELDVSSWLAKRKSEGK